MGMELPHPVPAASHAVLCLVCHMLWYGLWSGIVYDGMVGGGWGKKIQLSFALEEEEMKNEKREGRGKGTGKRKMKENGKRKTEDEGKQKKEKGN